MLTGAGAGALGIGALGAGLGYALTHRSGASDLATSEAAQIGHLLRRAGFGPSPADVGDYLTAGMHGSINRLINYANVPDTLDQQLAALQLDFSKVEDLVRWVLLRMIYSKHPLEEKMTLFWHGVLTSSVTKIGGKRNYPLLIQQNNLLRAHAMGKFDDLIAAISIDPAMLWWLDGRISTGHSPNENYSRELMELFTMGLDTYTQDDVHNGALALTGWTILGGRGVFVPGRHYTGQITFLGQTGQLGLSDVVKLVCSHPSTAHHVAWRMWSFFVYDNPSDGDLQPLVDAYNVHDHSIAAMVRAMLTSPRFFSTSAYRARIKSPVEFLAGAIRGLGVQSSGKGLPGLLQVMGQVPLDPPNVSGWDGDKASAVWLSTQAWMTRVNFVNLLVSAAGSSSSSGSLIQQTINARKISSGMALVDYFVAALLDNQLDAGRRSVLYDAVAERSGGPALRLAGGATIPAASVRSMLYLLMCMPEYQLN